jgi:hypothetical protein
MPDPNKGHGGFDGANTPDPLPPATPGPGDGTAPPPAGPATFFVRPADLTFEINDQTELGKVDPIENAEVSKRALRGYTYMGNRAVWGDALVEAWDEIDNVVTAADRTEFVRHYGSTDVELAAFALLTGLVRPLSPLWGKMEYFNSASHLGGLRGLTLGTYLIKMSKAFNGKGTPSGG